MIPFPSVAHIFHYYDDVLKRCMCHTNASFYAELIFDEAIHFVPPLKVT